MSDSSGGQRRKNRDQSASSNRRPRKPKPANAQAKSSDSRSTRSQSAGPKPAGSKSAGSKSSRPKKSFEPKSKGPKPASAQGGEPRGRGGSDADKPKRKRDFRKGSPDHKKARARRSAAVAEKRDANAASEVVKKKRTTVPEGATVPFATLKLAEPIARAIEEGGYQFASPIQAAAIPPALEGRDVLGCAQTGTGKTAAFALPILSQMSASTAKAVPHRPMSLMLAPTRELAAQIQESVTVYGRELRLRSTVIFGGVGQGQQVRALERGVHILVATPGRLIDLMDQGYIDLSGLETFVVDEADRMLDMGFLPALKRIIRELPEERQSLFFSATISDEIAQLVGELLRDPVAIDVTPPERSVELIEQSVQFVRRSEKPTKLVEILTQEDVGQAVVFTRTKRGANDVAERLAEVGISAEAIHGNKSQNARLKTLNGFRVGRVKVLVATDVAARGLDIDDVTHVINYELPNEPESYVHRIGRTGRAGATGKAVAFCDANEKDYLRAIEKLIEQKIPVDGEDNVGYARPEKQGNRRAAAASKNNDRRPSRPRRPRRDQDGEGRGSEGGGSGHRRPRNRGMGDREGRPAGAASARRRDGGRGKRPRTDRTS